MLEAAGSIRLSYRLRLEDDELRLVSLDQAIARAQAIVRQHVPRERSLVEELLAERRRVAARE